MGSWVGALHLDRGQRGRYGFGIGEVAEWLKAAVC
jgi:hypothetical protein